MPMTNKYSMRGSLRPPLGKPLTSKSPNIPAIYHSQTASTDGVADTDTTMTRAWIADGLQMESWTHVSNLLHLKNKHQIVSLLRTETFLEVRNTVLKPTFPNSLSN